MSVSNTIKDYANSLELQITRYELDAHTPAIAIWDEQEENIPLVIYRAGKPGEFHYVSAPGLGLDTIEELPAWIDSEQKLLEVIDFLAQEVA